MNLQLKIITISSLLMFSAISNAADSKYPKVKLPELESGQIVDLEKLRGKVVYIDFWASWCGPCRKSMPKFNVLYNKLSSKGLKILAINLDEKDADAKAFLNQVPVKYTVLRDSEGKTPQQFGVKVMPTGYLLDRFGLIRYTHEGFRDGDDKVLESKIKQLLAE